MNTHPLATFVYETFGQQFGDLVLAGYGAEPSDVGKTLSFSAAAAGTEVVWDVELVAAHLPCRDEPLVLAALLKLLLSRPDISTRLDFQLDELITELQWPEHVSTRARLDEIIASYTSLLYVTCAPKGAGVGYSHLLTGYLRASAIAADTSLPVRVNNSVQFDYSFIAALREGRINFASIDFGPRNM